MFLGSVSHALRLLDLTSKTSFNYRVKQGKPDRTLRAVRCVNGRSALAGYFEGTKGTR